MATKKCKMNPKEKALWVKALLSGKFKQGTGRLMEVKDDSKGKEIETYCCLGVAQVAITGRKPIPTTFLKAGRFGLSMRLQVALAAANDGDFDKKKIFKEAGFDTCPGRSYGQSKSTFKTIANWIKKNL